MNDQLLKPVEVSQSMENVTEELICEPFEDEIKTFQDWIKTQPQLPQNMSIFDCNFLAQASDLNYSYARKTFTAAILESVRLWSGEGARIVDDQF